MKCFQDDPRGNGEAGFTLIELMMVMVISLVIGAAALMAIQTGQTSTQKTSARQEAVQEAEVALARITKETRQALVAVLRSSTFLDLKTYVRVNGGASQLRRVQYDCSQGAACTRKDCGSISSSGSLLSLAEGCSGTSATVLRGISQATFGAQSQGVTIAALPAEARGAAPAFDYVTMVMRIRLDDRSSGRRSAPDLDPVEIQTGVKLENVGTP